MKKLIAIILSALMLFSTISAFGADAKMGIDVSEHNTVDYAKEMKSGTEFVIIRLGYYNHLDKKFWDNVKAVCNKGLDFGVYLYSYAYSLEEAQIEADFTIKTLNSMPEEYKKHFTLPVAYDMEDQQLVKFGKSQLTAQTVLYCEAIKNAGYTPMVYANLNWFTNYLDVQKLYSKGYKMWYAYWTSKPDFSKPIKIGKTGIEADMWQYQSGEEHKSGLDQNVVWDINKIRHIYNFEVTKPATKTENGTQKRICTICGEVKNLTIYKPETYTLSTSTYTYNGSAKDPSLTIKDSKGNKLIKNTDYKLTYPSGRTKVGTYTYGITFIGKYSGTAKKSFKINPVKTSLTSLSATSKGFKAVWSKKSTQVTGYQIQYSTSSKFTSPKTVTVSSYKTTSKTVSKLTANKKYYVRVRTYKTVNDKDYYSGWSSSKYVTTKK